MGMLKTGELLEFRRPGRRNIADLSGGGHDGTGNQILVRVDKLVVLQTQQYKIVYVFFNELGALLILDGSSAKLVLGVQNTLRHEYLDDVEECGVAVQVKANLIQNEGLGRNQLILLAIELHVVPCLASLQRCQSALVGQLVILLLGLRRFVPWQLSQKLARTWHIGVFLKILGGNKQTTECLEHNRCLFHILLLLLQITG